jgi:adenylate kinase
VCRDCGTNYTATGLERRPWLCDVCGGDVIQREDDTEDAINRRLDGYETQTRPLIDFYASRGLLVTVSGVGTPDDVLVRLISAIESRRRGPGAGPVVG